MTRPARSKRAGPALSKGCEVNATMALLDLASHGAPYDDVVPVTITDDPASPTGKIYMLDPDALMGHMIYDGNLYLDWFMGSTRTADDFDDDPAVSIRIGDPGIDVGDWGIGGYVVASDLYMNPGPHPDHVNDYPFGAGSPLDGETYKLTASLLRAAASHYLGRN